MTSRMTSQPAWTWELSAYGRYQDFHYARRRSDNGVERHPDGRSCPCPNAAAYAPITPARAVLLWALAFLAFGNDAPEGGYIDPRTPAEMMLAGLITPQDFTRRMLS